MKPYEILAEKIRTTPRKHRPLLNPRVVCEFSIPVWWRRKLGVYISRGEANVKVRVMFVWCKYNIIGNDRFWGTNQWWFWDIG